MTSRVLVNIGCGENWHPDWYNFDVAPAVPLIHELDVVGGLPFANGSVDACYCSHVLEHLTIANAEKLVKECARIIREGGVVRLVVPDLEAIVREYIRALDDVLAGRDERSADYFWMKLELLDQLARDVSGGDMARYMSDREIANIDFVRGRIGVELDGSRGSLEGTRGSIWERIRSKDFRTLLGVIRRKLVDATVMLLGGTRELDRLRIGRFRLSGEVHRWMYDRYSLPKLLVEAGFVDVRVCDASESRIEGFEGFELDMVEGAMRKPDSLFVEAVKP